MTAEDIIERLVRVALASYDRVASSEQDVRVRDVLVRERPDAADLIRRAIARAVLARIPPEHGVKPALTGSIRHELYHSEHPP
jgi:hypothetical protein